MAKKTGLVIGSLVFLLVLGFALLLESKPRNPSYAVDNNVDPRIYMPLAVGNTWTYVWQNKVVSDVNEPEETRKPTVFHINLYFKDNKPHVYYGSYYLYEHSTFKDTFTIYSKKQDHYYFKTSCAGKECEYHCTSNCRYHHSLENSWTWTNTQAKGQLNIILTETMKTDALNADAKKDIKLASLDNRNIIHAVKKNNQWDILGMTMTYGQGIEIEYDFTDHTVTVPAGKFKHCILVKETYKGSFHRTVNSFTVYRYYAPNVGRVKEYQQLADGTITYTMELETYKLAK